MAYIIIYSSTIMSMQKENNGMFGNDDFMNFMGYRNMVVEDKIEE